MARIFIGTAVAVVGLSAAFIACEPVKEEAQPVSGETAASTVEISAFDNAIKSIGRVENAVKLALGKTTVPQDALAVQMKQALLDGNCQMEYNKDQTTDAEKFSALKVMGSTCPMTANYEKRILTNGKVSLNVSFNITDANLATLNDMANLAVSGDGHTVVDTSTNNKESLIEFSGHGEANSRSQGRIAVAIGYLMKQSSTGGHITMSGFRRIIFQFPQFTVAIKSDDRVINNVDYSQYTMNEQPLSKEEFVGYLLPLGIVLN